MCSVKSGPVSDATEVKRTDPPEVPEAYRDIMAYGEGRACLLVATAHQGSPAVLSFLARLEKMGCSVNVKSVDMKELSALRQKPSRPQEEANTRALRDIKKLFAQAMEQQATDIHIRVQKEYAQVRFRIHGELRDYAQWPVSRSWALCAALYTSVTDVSDTTFNPMQRQDARISGEEWLPKQMHSVRVATTPTESGFVMVLRLLYEEFLKGRGLKGLGYSSTQVQQIQAMKRRLSGLNIIAGPTGSGKSTTLKRVLREILEEHDYRLNVMTVEDPPEYPIEGAVQTPVTNAESQDQRQEAFNRAITGTLRMDPDVIMIGEIRDPASAQLALRAAITGHQVWTTLHANSAFGVIDRLEDLEVPLALLAKQHVLSGAVFQRLVRTLCPDCKRAAPDGSAQVRGKNGLHGPSGGTGGGRRPSGNHTRKGKTEHGMLYRRGEGCETCGGSGLSGRSVIAEVLLPDPKTLAHIRRDQRDKAEKHWKEQLNGKTIQEHAQDKMSEGTISVDESPGQVCFPQGETS